MNVFAYYNYRKYLQDYYEYRKSVQRYFSYRVFAKRAGYTSSGLYLDLVKGRKSLTPEVCPCTRAFRKGGALFQPDGGFHPCGNAGVQAGYL